MPGACPLVPHAPHRDNERETPRHKAVASQKHMRAETTTMRACIRISIVSLFLVLPLLAADQVADDWPVFHGNPEMTGLARTMLPDKLEILWTFKTGDAI